MWVHNAYVTSVTCSWVRDGLGVGGVFWDVGYGTFQSMYAPLGFDSACVAFSCLFCLSCLHMFVVQ